MFGRKKRRQDPIAAPAGPDVGAWIPYDRSAPAVDAVAEVDTVQDHGAPGGGSAVSRETHLPPAGTDPRLGAIGHSEFDVSAGVEPPGHEIGADPRSASLGTVPEMVTSIDATANAPGTEDPT